MYLCLTLGYAASTTIAKRRRAIRKAIKEVVKLYIERDVSTALSIRNRLHITKLLNLVISSKVIVYREKKK